MSHIDIFKHELVGLVAGVQLYHPLEATDFGDGVGPEALLLGGGSGEHSEAILSPADCVASYLLLLPDVAAEPGSEHWLRPRYLELLGCEDLEAAEELLAGDMFDALVADVDPIRGSDFSRWSGDDWAAFAAAASSPGCWTTAYDRKVHGSIEHWVRQVVGEFVLVSMPELIADRMVDHQATFAAVRQIAADAKLMLGVMTFPSGYEQLGGRREQLGDGNVRH